MLVRGLCDEIREEVLGAGEIKSLDDTVKIVEAKEAGRRSARHLGTEELASSKINRVTAYKKQKKGSARPD